MGHSALQLGYFFVQRNGRNIRSKIKHPFRFIRNVNKKIRESDKTLIMFHLPEKSKTSKRAADSVFLMNKTEKIPLEGLGIICISEVSILIAVQN